MEAAWTIVSAALLDAAPYGPSADGSIATLDELVAIANRRGANALQVGTRIGFCHGYGAYLGASSHTWQPALPLIFVAVMPEVGRDNLTVYLGAKT